MLMLVALGVVTVETSINTFKPVKVDPSDSHSTMSGNIIRILVGGNWGGTTKQGSTASVTHETGLDEIQMYRENIQDVRDKQIV